MHKLFLIGLFSILFIGLTQAQTIFLGPKMGFTTDLFFPNKSLNNGSFIHTHNGTIGLAFKWLPEKSPFSLAAGFNIVGKTIYNKALRMENLRGRYNITSLDFYVRSDFRVASSKKENKEWVFPLGVGLSLNQMSGLSARIPTVQTGVSGTTVTVLGDNLKQNFIYPVAQFGFGQLHKNLGGKKMHLQWQMVGNLSATNIFKNPINVDLAFDSPDASSRHQEQLQGLYGYISTDIILYFGLGGKKKKKKKEN